MGKNNKRLKILKHDFSKGVEVTDHFIDRAHERFGVTDLHDQAKNHDYVTRWAMGLLQDYSEIESQPNNDDIKLVKCRQIIIVYETSKNKCLTCYPISYNNYTKQYDSLKTAIKKRELQLDDFTQDKVDETFQSIYYKEARKYANDLAKLHTKLAALYEVQSKSSHNSVIDNKQQSINQVNSIIIEIENKLLNIHNVVFDKREDKVRTS